MIGRFVGIVHICGGAPAGSGGATCGAGGGGSGGAARGGDPSAPPLITIDSGVYRPPGTGGATSAAGGTSTTLPPSTLMPVAVNDCPGSLDAATVMALRQGGGSSARLLYPYDGTVFPVGLLGPVFQWDGAAMDATYVHLKSGLFDYQGCF